MVKLSVDYLDQVPAPFGEQGPLFLQPRQNSSIAPKAKDAPRCKHEPFSTLGFLLSVVLGSFGVLGLFGLSLRSHVPRRLLFYHADETITQKSFLGGA